MTSNTRRFSICSPKSLYKKISQEILAELKAAFKTGVSKGSEAPTRPTQSATTYLLGVCQQPALTHTAITTKKKNVTKINFSSCNDHSPKWIINDCYIFFPYLRVWVFLFLRTSFFTAQHVGPTLHASVIVSEEYHLHIAYFSEKPFSFFRFIDDRS